MDTHFFEFLGLHALISLLPGFLGSILGLGMGHLLSRPLFQHNGTEIIDRRIYLLVPWRALIVLGLVLLLPSPYPAILFGLGILPGLLTVFLSAAVLAIGLALHARIVPDREIWGAGSSSGIVRTALVASVGFAVITYQFGSGGAGVLIRQGMRLLEYDVMWSGYAIVGVLAILADIAAGAVQAFILPRTKPNVPTS